MASKEDQPKKWETYEEVAAYLLNRFSSHFGVSRFEGKQDMPGKISGTSWQIDGKGYTDGEDRFLIVECKRHTAQGISQAIVGGLAWTIQDTGADGGILVSPLGLQEGAEKVAPATKIIEFKLDQNSTTTNYVAQYLNKLRIGRSVEVEASIGEDLKIHALDKDGKIVEEHKPNIK